MWKIILIGLALLYILNPFDLLPDMIFGWGWIDDLIIMGFLWRYLHFLKKRRHFQNYRQNGSNASNQKNQRKAYGNGSTHTNTNTQDPSDVRSAYEILEIERGSSREEIKRAYRQLAGKYHPDKVEHLGDEFKKLAEKRFKEIQQAYQELMSN
ncbi:MAG: DnaJ domain-containing protein [Desulfobacterales bacterium]|jgi:DnaJ like chaperone protein